MADSKSRTIMIGGQAKLPRDLFGESLLQMAVELDSATGTVVGLSVTPALPVVEGYLRRVMIGFPLTDEADRLRETLQQGMSYRGQKAILSALSDIVRQYVEIRQDPPDCPGDPAGRPNPSRARRNP